MLTKKKEEMTEEEQYQLQEFEKKKKTFYEEREKRKKMLSTELTKLYKSTGSTIEEFDHQMCAAYIQRIDTEEHLYYHELEIMHLIATLNNERKFLKQINQISDEIDQKHEEHRQHTPAYKDLSAEAAAAQKASTTADENLKSIQDQVDKDFKARDNQPQLIKWYRHSVAQRVRPKPTNTPNTFSQFYVQPFEFVSAMDEIMDPAKRPPSLPEQRWKNFIDYCESKMRASKEQAERSMENEELKNLENKYKDDLDKIEQRFIELETEKNETQDRLLNALIDMHVPFTFRQGQVEIPNDTILVDYDDIVLINKKVVISRNQLILEAGQRKIAELENIRRQHSEHKELKWKISKCNVDIFNLKEEIQEYQLFRVTKLDQKLIRTRIMKNQPQPQEITKPLRDRGKNEVPKEKPSELEILKKGLNTMTEQHKTKMERAAQNLKKLEKKLEKKKQENEKIENEILQMQLSLKERSRIYEIQDTSNKGTAEVRSRRLKQVMLISKLKRAREVQESKIAALRDEVTRLRKCVYTSFGNDDDSTMVGYNS